MAKVMAIRVQDDFLWSLQITPVCTHAHIRNQWHTQLHDVLHFMPHESAHGFDLLLRHVEDQFVVHLQGHA
jgi:hypothetical protein